MSKIKSIVKVTREEMARIVSSYRGNHIFSVYFIKKNGEARTMTCRKHVQIGLTGTGLKYNPNDYSLMNVWDTQAKGYRMVNLQTLQRIQIDGFRFEVI